MWLVLVRAIASVVAPPSTLPLPTSNFGSTRSRGLKLGVLEFDTFSDSTRWRSWCHCILVRRTDRVGRSLIAIAALPLGQRPMPLFGVAVQKSASVVPQVGHADV